MTKRSRNYFQRKYWWKMKAFRKINPPKGLIWIDDPLPKETLDFKEWDYLIKTTCAIFGISESELGSIHGTFEDETKGDQQFKQSPLFKAGPYLNQVYLANEFNRKLFLSASKRVVGAYDRPTQHRKKS